MYEYIREKYKGISRDYIIIESNGIGYKIFTSRATMSSMPRIDEEVKLCLEQIIREDFLGLYGLDARERLEIFKLLLSINGVSAKATSSLLSINGTNNLRYTIVMGDEGHLCETPGIGKKIAGRIILELRDKIKREDISEVIEGSGEFGGLVSSNTGNMTEALGTLLALGYSEKEVEAALKKVDKTDTLEGIIKNCLGVLIG